MNILDFIRTIFFYLLTSLAILIAALPVLISVLLPEKYRYNTLCFFFINLVYKTMIFGSLLPIKVVGSDNIPAYPAIYAANHQSALDIPLMGYLLGLKKHVWLLKYELTKIPVIGFVGRRIAVSVDRSSLRRSIQSLIDAVLLTKNKNRNLLIFPEGSRFSDKKVHEFLSGFALIARKCELPVVPVYIAGSGQAMPQGSLWIKHAPITLVIGEPIFLDIAESNEEFTAKVHLWFLKQTNTE